MKENDVHICAVSAHCIFLVAPEADENLDPAQRASIVGSYRDAGSGGPQGLSSSAVRAFALVSNELTAYKRIWFH